MSTSVRHPSAWRLQQQQRGEGRYYTLIRGTGSDRVSLSLGLRSGEAARRFLLAMDWIGESYAETCVLAHMVDQGQTFATQVRGAGRLEAAAPLLGVSGAGAPEDLAELMEPPHYRGSANTVMSRAVDPLWLVEYARRGSGEREEVLRFLWATGEFLEEHAASLAGKPPPPPPPEVVLGKVPLPNLHTVMPLRQYVEQVWAPVRRAETPGTWSREERLWNTYILPEIGSCRLGALDKRVFDGFIRRFRLRDGSEPSGATRHLVRSAYKACLVHADREGHIEGIHEFYRLKGTTVRRMPPKEVLSEEEIARVVEAAEDPIHAALYAFAFETGCRPSEVTRLRWEDIRWETQPARRPWGSFTVRGTKTQGASAELPLGPTSRGCLEALWRFSGAPDQGPVFVWRGAPIGNFKHALASAVRRAGIERHVVPYGLRHSFATHVMEAGIADGDAAKWMRHTKPQMLRKTYDHSRVADRIRVGDVFGGEGEGEEE